MDISKDQERLFLAWSIVNRPVRWFVCLYCASFAASSISTDLFEWLLPGSRGGAGQRYIFPLLLAGILWKFVRTNAKQTLSKPDPE